MYTKFISLPINAILTYAYDITLAMNFFFLSQHRLHIETLNEKGGLFFSWKVAHTSTIIDPDG